MRQSKLGARRCLCRLSHAPGEAQADFGEAMVVIAGVEQTAHFLAFDLPHSDDCFVVAFPAETTEAFLEGHVRAFAYFGGVPTRILYDNTKLAVARILGDGERQKTTSLLRVAEPLSVRGEVRPSGKGNDKGKVEGLVGYARRNFMVPIPRASSWEELNAHLEADCREAPERRLRGHTETIGSASSATAQRCCRCRLRPMKPVKRSPRGSAHCRWCAIDPTTTRCPPSMDIARCW